MREFCTTIQLYEHKQFACEPPTIELSSQMDNGIENQFASIESLLMPKKSFECDECGRFFSKRSNMLHYRMIHSDERPFECWMCHKKWVNKRTGQIDSNRKHQLDEIFISILSSFYFKLVHPVKQNIWDLIEFTILFVCTIHFRFERSAVCT